MRGQRPLGMESGRYRVVRGEEGDEKSVALAIHLAAAMGSRGSAQQPLVLGTYRRVARCSQPPDQAGRAFDIGEQEGDGTCR
jgi:hypothetical protein